MSTLSRKERFKVLELVAEIAGEASHNTNVIWMIEFQEELVDKLYRKMIALLEEPGAAAAGDAAAAERDAGAGDAPVVAAKSVAAPPRTAPRPRKAAKKTR
jgi:hypothetical protein